MFEAKQVVWAKVKGYPWWPAIINKLPEKENGNFKVLFIAEDTYALLDPKAVRKYQEYYRDNTKTGKTKKLTTAIMKADELIKNKSQVVKKMKKNIQKEPEKPVIQYSEEQESEGCSQSEINVEKESMEENENMVEEEVQIIDRAKIQSSQEQLLKIVIEFQNNRVKEWKFGEFFRKFRTDHLTNQELLQSNLTRMLRYIIDQMKACQFDCHHIQAIEDLSKNLKTRILNHLTNTSYYDQYLKIVEKNRQNKAQIEVHITRTLKKMCKIKKQFITFFVGVIGNSINNGIPFNQKQFLSHLKEKKYDIEQMMISKAATQRFANLVIDKYQ